MFRGDIVWANFEPALASEADKIRPAVIVTNERANRAVRELGRGAVTVVPLTSRTEPLLPFQVLIGARGTGLRTLSKAQVEQIRAISVDRIRGPIGRAPSDVMAVIDDAIRLHLAL